MPREFSRKLRVASELHRLLNEVLRVEVKDPRLDGVIINDVEVSGDLGVAKIYYGTLDPADDASDAGAGFRNAAGFLRSRIGQTVRLRRVPELQFVRDTSAQRGLELSQLIDELRPASDEDGNDTSPGRDSPSAQGRDRGDDPDERSGE